MASERSLPVALFSHQKFRIDKTYLGHSSKSTAGSGSAMLFFTTSLVRLNYPPWPLFNFIKLTLLWKKVLALSESGINWLTFTIVWGLGIKCVINIDGNKKNRKLSWISPNKTKLMSIFVTKVFLNHLLYINVPCELVLTFVSGWTPTLFVFWRGGRRIRPVWGTEWPLTASLKMAVTLHLFYWRKVIFYVYDTYTFC